MSTAKAVTLSGVFLVASPAEAQLSDDELVQRIVAGEVSLFEVLMRRNNQRLYRAARAIVGATDAEDVVQQSYLDAFRSLAQFEGRAQLATWLTRIVVRRALAVAATKRRLPANVVDVETIATPAADAPEHAASRDELRRVLEDAVEALPEGCREAFVLRDVENLSTREAAELLDITEDALKVRLHRARSLVKARLDREVPDLVEEIFAFGLGRCDRMVVSVLGRVAPSVMIPNRGALDAAVI